MDSVGNLVRWSPVVFGWVAGGGKAGDCLPVCVVERLLIVCRPNEIMGLLCSSLCCCQDFETR